MYSKASIAFVTLCIAFNYIIGYDPITGYAIGYEIKNHGYSKSNNTDYPEHCLDPDSGIHYRCGTNTMRSGKCELVTCTNKYILLTKGCTILTLAPHCKALPQNLSLPFPQCCSEVECDMVSSEAISNEPLFDDYIEYNDDDGDDDSDQGGEKAEDTDQDTDQDPLNDTDTDTDQDTDQDPLNDTDTDTDQDTDQDPLNDTDTDTDQDSFLDTNTDTDQDSFLATNTDTEQNLFE